MGNKEETTEILKNKRNKPRKATADHSLERKDGSKKKNKTQRWQLQAAERYLKAHDLDSIKLRLSKEDKEKIKTAAENANKSMNEFIISTMLDAISDD